MAATTDLAFRDRAVYVPAADALVCADLHLGRDATANVELPLGERTDVEGRLGALLERFEPATVVVAGDVLHAFDELPRGVPDQLDALAARIRDAGAELVITPGNHDTMLGSVWDGPAPDAYRLDDGETDVLHGHEAPEREAELYLVGHDHPAIRIEGRKRPCYLYGAAVHDGADVLALPAFNRLAAGTVVNGARRGDMQSPCLTDVGAFRPIVRDPDADDTLWFPPLSELRSML